jgi:hypothetical protein
MGVFEGIGAYGVVLLGSALYAFVVGIALGAGAWMAWRLLERRRASEPAPAPGAAWMLWILIPVGAVWAGWALVAGPRLLPVDLPVEQQSTFVVVQFVPFVVMLSVALTGIWLLRRALRS